jgi:hypothetical protein
MQSKANTVKEYLQSLPEDRRSALEALRKTILAHLDEGFEEGMQYGMIGYYVPHSKYPKGYHCNPKEPLPFAGLASQKNYMSLYLMSCYDNGPQAKWLKQAWVKAGKKLNMGKCCIRFTRLEDVPMKVVAEVFKRITADEYITMYELNIRTHNKKASNTGSAKHSTPQGSRVISVKKRAKKS